MALCRAALGTRHLGPLTKHLPTPHPRGVLLSGQLCSWLASAMPCAGAAVEEGRGAGGGAGPCRQCLWNQLSSGDSVPQTIHITPLSLQEGETLLCPWKPPVCGHHMSPEAQSPGFLSSLSLGGNSGFGEKVISYSFRL